ncbi:hypothetical protein GCM10010299_66850 [Streptomyces tanashiensis]|nr:hypothetical protein GCM10010299_66850 [Streptomyces tanashiensis]
MAGMAPTLGQAKGDARTLARGRHQGSTPAPPLTRSRERVPAETQPLPSTGRVIGIDRGVRETATTTSDDHDLAHAEHGKASAQRLARYQRMTARRRPVKGRAASKRHRSAKRQADPAGRSPAGSARA